MLDRDRWAKLDQILEALLQRPPEEREGWLEKLCGEDRQLRAEVEQLLALSRKEDDSLRPGGAMSGPLWEEAAKELAIGKGSPTLQVGEGIGGYEILGPIGAGGMGAVYRARHPGLERDVAIKVLAAEFADDASRLRRFEREAKILASLNHPNIGNIYDLLLIDGTPYLVLELVEGATLRERLAGGPLPLDETLEIAVQIAAALEEAHRKGIVHRDLKPANVKIAPENRVKVLDFGLAKELESPGQRSLAEPWEAVTHSGAVLGTPGYMSPEQARGLASDERADVWAFGCLLYEMLSGRRAFHGETTSDALASVLRDDLDWSALPATAPPELPGLLRRCLEKDREKRLRDVGELRTALTEIRTAARAAPDTARQPVRRWTRNRMVVLSLVLVVLVAAGALFLGRQAAQPLQLTNPIQVTSAVGREDFPVWSPDGLQIAFRSDRDGGGIFLMSPLAGPPRKLVAGRDAPTLRSRAEWFPDGLSLAYVVLGGEPATAESLEIRSLSSDNARRLKLPGRWTCRCEISLSPDGRFLAYVDAQAHAAQVSQLWVSRLADGKAVRLTDGMSSDWSPSWSPDSRTLFFVSNRGGSMDLWQQRLRADGAAAGSPERLTVGVGMQRAALSPDGKRLAYSRGRRIGNLYRVPLLLDRRAGWLDAEQLTFDEALVEFLDVSPDGTRVVISSDRAGNPDLWILPAGGGELSLLTNDPTPDWLPAWSRWGVGPLPGGDSGRRAGTLEPGSSQLAGVVARRQASLFHAAAGRR